jgi:hypothetical protein
MVESQISVGLMVEVFGEAIGKHARAARQLIDPERAKRARCFQRDMRSPGPERYLASSYRWHVDCSA